MPLLYGLLVHPDGQRTALHQGLVVLLPVAELVLGLAYLMIPEVVLLGQMHTELTDSSQIFATRP
ncbi:hypothetical protein ACE1BH_25130 [Aeromonas jandaei]